MARCGFGRTRSLDAPPKFYFTDLLSVAPTGRLGPVERLLPVSMRRRRAAEAGRAYLERLLHTNAARFANDLIERVGVSRHALEARVRQILTDAVRRAQEALDAARTARAEGAESVAAELSRVRALRNRIDAVDAGRREDEEVRGYEEKGEPGMSKPR